MKKSIIKGTIVFGMFVMLSLGVPQGANAMFSTTSAGGNMMNMFNNTNYAMDSMQNDQLLQQANATNTQKSSEPQRVSATGYLTKEGDNYFIGEGKEKHQIITNQGDILAVMPLIAGTEVAVEFIGQYDDKKKIVYATNLNLLKNPSPDLLEQINEALDAWKAEQPVSGKGYVILEDGKYKLEVKNKVYTIEAEVSDIEVVLPFVADDDDLMIELIGPLDEENKIFKAQQLNFASKLPKELLDEINNALLDNKDGKEVDARGYIRDKDGTYLVKVLGESYTMLLSEEHPDIKRIVPVLAGEEILINVIGDLDRAAKTIDVKQLDIIDKPSAKLLKEINEAIAGYEEGNAQVRGLVISKTDGLYFKVNEKEYKMTVEDDKEDLTAFFDVLKNEDQVIQVSGYVSNKNLTIKAGAASIIGQPSSALKAELAEVMSEYVTIPETGKLVDANGEIILKDDKYYISVAFHDYLIKTPKVDMQKSLVVLSESGIPVVITGKINNEERFIDAEKLVILEEPDKETKEKLDKILAETKANDNTTSDTVAKNPFANFGNFSGFENFFGNKTGSTGSTGDGETTSPFGNMDFGSLFANLGKTTGGTTGGGTTGSAGDTTGGAASNPFGDFGSLFQNFFGNGSGGETTNPFSSMFNGSGASGMPSLSFDQIQQQLNNMGTTPTTSTKNSGSTGSTSDGESGSGTSFGSGTESGGSGFSVGGDE